MIHSLKVEPVYFRREIVGYSVEGIHRDCSDSLWEPIAHEAIFRSQSRAECFLERVKRSSSIDRKRWGLPFGCTPSRADAFHGTVNHYSVL
jgi:hypothetical protein